VNELAESLSIGTEPGVPLMVYVLWALIAALYVFDRFKVCKWEQVCGDWECSQSTYYTDCHRSFTRVHARVTVPNKCPYCGRKVKLL